MCDLGLLVIYIHILYAHDYSSDNIGCLCVCVCVCVCVDVIQSRQAASKASVAALAAKNTVPHKPNNSTRTSKKDKVGSCTIFQVSIVEGCSVALCSY